MVPENEITPEQAEALSRLGLDAAQATQFCAGEAVTYQLVTSGQPGIAIVQLCGTRLRTGVVSINDVGGGVVSLIRFQQRSTQVAKVFRCTEIEVFAAEVINDKLFRVLLRKGFVESVSDCPDELGGGQMSILTACYSVHGQGAR